jgi:hypothetical protein
VQTASTAASVIEDEQVRERGDLGQRRCGAIEDLLYI